jgi:nucleoside-diphosphate-sugar epimerase
MRVLVAGSSGVFALTNRLRTEGTRNLLAAATRAGAARVISQGIAFGYTPGEGLAEEDTPLWTEGPVPFRGAVAALLELERRTAAAGGLVLRFGHLYGPGTAFDEGGSLRADVRAGKVPIVGGGDAVFSFTHTSDAAMAVLTALDKDVTGALNIVDDHPAPVSQWLPAYAAALGARKPRRVPVWLARLAAGSFGVAFFNQLRGADNTRARLLLDWRPGYRSWTEGLLGQR